MTETEIQAQGFKRLAGLVPLAVSSDQYVETINKTLAELAAHHSGLADIQHELARTRLVRLPHSQFVYWPHKQHPQIVNGESLAYLQERYAVYVVPRATAFEHIADCERYIWGTLDDEEVKVYWRDWTITELPGQQLQFTCTYCVAYIADGKVCDVPLKFLEDRGSPKPLQRSASWGPTTAHEDPESALNNVGLAREMSR